VFIVHPEANEIDGEPCYTNLAEVNDYSSVSQQTRQAVYSAQPQKQEQEMLYRL